jgi:hypothetical protein
MAKIPKDIQYLPGWYWVSAGKEEWTANIGTKAQHTTKERHAIDPTGAARSVRYTQDRQKDAEAAQGVVRKPVEHRTGKTRTTYGTTGGRKTSGSGTNRGQVIIRFTDFTSARNYAVLEGLGDFTYGLIQIKYSRRLSGTNRPGTNGKEYGGFSTLVGYQYNQYPNTKQFRENAGKPGPFSRGAATSAKLGVEGNPWEVAKERLQEFDMAGEDARVYIVLTNVEQG